MLNRVRCGTWNNTQVGDWPVFTAIVTVHCVKVTVLQIFTAKTAGDSSRRWRRRRWQWQTRLPCRTEQSSTIWCAGPLPDGSRSSMTLPARRCFSPSRAFALPSRCSGSPPVSTSGDRTARVNARRFRPTGSNRSGLDRFMSLKYIFWRRLPFTVEEWGDD